MTDTDELMKYITDSGITITALATKIGITRESLYGKIRNNTEFKASEIVALQNVLHMSNKKRDEIFFKTKVE